jgi:hypothetical protein
MDALHMLGLLFPLCDFIQVKALQPRDTGWPEPSPFNFRFTSRRLTEVQAGAISGSGLYMISTGPEVVYVGLYKPASGNIIADRWGRHLQTITGRGYNIGLGGRDPTMRRTELLNAVNAEGLRRAIEYAYTYSQKDRYRDTGYNTTPNRLRYASENWGSFGTAQGSEILQSLTFGLLRIRSAQAPGQAAEDVKAIEKAILKSFKPVCNDEYNHVAHAALRPKNTVSAITTAIRQAVTETTGQDITHRVQLAGA